MIKKAWKVLFLLMVISVTMGVSACKDKEEAPKYNCETCYDKGVIDCPNCHVKDCTNTSCHNGIISYSCWRCLNFCDYCDGFGYIMAGSLYLGDCTFCEAGRVYEDCSECQNKRYFTKSCSDCVDGYIGGKKCSDPNCSISYYKNEGYTYIDCPDCEKE